MVQDPAFREGARESRRETQEKVGARQRVNGAFKDSYRRNCTVLWATPASSLPNRQYFAIGQGFQQN
jgi:hypothetical protein